LYYTHTHARARARARIQDVPKVTINLSHRGRMD